MIEAFMSRQRIYSLLPLCPARAAGQPIYLIFVREGASVNETEIYVVLVL